MGILKRSQVESIMDKPTVNLVRRVNGLREAFYPYPHPQTSKSIVDFLEKNFDEVSDTEKEETDQKKEKPSNAEGKRDSAGTEAYSITNQVRLAHSSDIDDCRPTDPAVYMTRRFLTSNAEWMSLKKEWQILRNCSQSQSQKVLLSRKAGKKREGTSWQACAGPVIYLVHRSRDARRLGHHSRRREQP